MYVYIYMCVYVFVCMYVCVYYVCIMYACMYLCVCVCVSMYVCMYVCMYVETGRRPINVSLVAVQNPGRSRAIPTDVLRGFRQTLQANTTTAH
jgi:hypothetical protein